MSDSNKPTDEQVIEGCKQVLKRNQSGSYTMPAPDFYPHQWFWDSCFTAIGIANYDLPRAKAELKSLLRGQWSNGMIPNIIFSDSPKYSRDRNIWQSWRNPHAPINVATSGITQPPMLAEAVYQIGQKLPESERRKWYQEMYPALLELHLWIYRDRDPHGEGLAYLIHPWESGLDNSPPWIDQLHTNSKPTWIKVIETTKLDALMVFFRRDTKHAPPGQRLRNIDALLYYNSLARMRRKNWDTEAIMSRSYFSLQDLTYNCILVRANSLLQKIAKQIGHEIPDELTRNIHKSKNAIDKLWDNYYEEYYSRAFVSHKLVKEPSIAGLLPLYSGAISKERAEHIVKTINSPNEYGSKYPLPTVPISSEWFSEFAYWQGPTWINTNWLIADGLERYGFKDEAERVRRSSIELVRKHGPYEYFSTKSGQPAGAMNFSWSAALIVDFLSK